MRIVKITEESLKQGYDSDRSVIRKYLNVNRYYNVDRIEKREWRTDVYLKEVPSIPFNSVNFIKVK